MDSRVLLYTDGACRGNPGPGGWGALIDRADGSPIERLSGFAPMTTNNKMELQGAIEAIRRLPEGARALLRTDSEYLVKGITLWVRGWKRKGWVNSKREPVKNKEFWIELLDLTSRRAVEFEWVKGHSGEEGNEIADALANEAIDRALSGGAAR